MLCAMSRTDHRYCIALTTAGSEEQAMQIARGLVERRVAACVNVVRSICSVYRWKGEITEEGESLLVIKTEASRIEEVRAAVRELHSYEVPELVVLPIVDGDPDYLAWLSESLGDDG